MFSFNGGLGKITDGLRRKLDQRVILNSEVVKIRSNKERFEVSTARESFTAPAVISAIPPHKAAPLVGEILPDAGKALESLPMAPVTLIHWSQKETGIDFPKGFGFLMPRIYTWRVLGTLFPSQLFSKRSRNGTQLFASFYGGMLDPKAINLDDGEQTGLLLEEHAAIFNVKIEKPGLLKIMRYKYAIPQLLPDHPEKIEFIKHGLSKYPGLFLAGNYITGVGMEHAVRSGYEAADECAAFLSGRNKSLREE